MQATLIAFKAFVTKEFYHIFRDVRTMLILLFMPIVQILLFGFVLSTEVQNVRFGILDLSKDTTSQKISLALMQNPYFTLQSSISSLEELKNLFYDNSMDLAVVFKQNFEENLKKMQTSIQLLIDASDPSRAGAIDMYARSIIADVLNKEIGANQNVVQIFNTMLFNPQEKSVYNFVPGLLGMILMLICAMMTSISIVREKERGNMEILLVSPIKPFLIIVAKIIPYFFISCVSSVGVLFISIFVLKISIVGNVFLLLFVCVLYIFLALSIGIMVSTIAKTQVIAMLVCAAVFLMPIMMLSGMIFPIESMPLILQYVTHIIPTKWFIIAIKKIMLEGLGIQYILQEIAILSFMAFLVLLVSLKKFKVRLE